jgi:peptidoglycan-associated lipoprotein
LPQKLPQPARKGTRKHGDATVSHLKNKVLAILTALSALALGACSSTPVAPPPAPKPVAVVAPPPPKPATPPAALPAPAPVSTVTTVTLPEYLNPKSELYSGRSLYFDFDKAVVKPEYTPLIERHGKFLVANPKVHIRIEGNTDERGSAEYNLALGQRRAAAVLNSLKLYGVPESQMEAVSWGEEKPKVTGHDESAWAQNRRADLQYPSN